MFLSENPKVHVGNFSFLNFEFSSIFRYFLGAKEQARKMASAIKKKFDVSGNSEPKN